MRTLEELWDFFKTHLHADLVVLENERKAVLQKLLIAYVIIGALSIAGFLFFYTVFRGEDIVVAPLVFGAMGATGAYFWLTSSYRSNFKDVVIEPLINFIDEKLSYNKSGYVSQHIYDRSRIFLQSVERYRGDDLIQGKIGQTQISFSELHTEYSVRTKNSRRWVTIFKGMFFTADFNKHFQGRTVVLPDQAEKTLGGLGQFFQSKNFSRDPLVRMDDPVFEKEFVVYGTDQIEARYILTSSLMKRIMDFRQKTGRQIYLSFVDSNIFIAIPYTKNLFEPTVFQTLLNFSVIKEYFIDLKTALDIVDELNLNTRIWTKE